MKSFMGVWNLRRFFMHLPLGIIIVFSFYVHWVFPLVITVLFNYYEKNEDKHLHDEAYRDVQGALAGVVLTVVGILLYEVVVKFS